MKDVKQVSWLGALVLLSAGAVSLGCSSSNGNGGTGGGSATGGTPGTGGGHGGGAGSKACGGPAPAADAGVCQLAPCDGVIATFSSRGRRNPHHRRRDDVERHRRSRPTRSTTAC